MSEQHRVVTIETGYKVVSVRDDGSYLVDSPEGQRSRVWPEWATYPHDDEADQLRLQLAAKDAALLALRSERDEAFAVARRVLMVEPKPDGTYDHIVHCSGDRRVPPGTPGHCCCCPVGKPTKSLAALRSAHEQLRDAATWADRQLSAFVTDEDSGVYSRATGSELVGFGAKRDVLRAALAASAPSPQQEPIKK